MAEAQVISFEQHVAKIKAATAETADGLAKAILDLVRDVPGFDMQLPERQGFTPMVKK